jgi:hypothetical protein
VTHSINLGLSWRRDIERREFTILAARGHRSQPFAHRIGRFESRVRHAERVENFVSTVFVGAPAIDLFDNLTQPINTDAISPTRSRISHHRIEKRRFQAGQYGRMPGH